ncbi:MAG: transketolase C-terminal domain-containing protein [Candidatus Bathyarchaeia archaeon]
MSKLESMRISYGKALAEYGAINPNVIVLDADVSSSTQSHFFASRFPERFFNLGIAEAGMVDVAVGLALGGKIPFVNTFAFLIALRAAEQVRTCVAYARTNVKLAAAYGGLSDSKDGPTHHSICDLAVMRAIPNLTVVVPADAVEVRKMVPLVAEWDGPVYLRISRAEVPVLFDENCSVEIGKGVLLQEGSDVTLIATGVMLSRCLDAAEKLRKTGIDPRIIEVHTLKPLDQELILVSAKETGAIVTAEEHSIIGGLGEAVCSFLAEKYPVPVKRVGIHDTFTETGPYFELMDKYGLGVNDIISAATEIIKYKR